MAGGSVDASWNLDGTSIVGRIAGKTTELPERPLYWRQHGSKGDRSMRLGTWKVTHQRSKGQSPALCDLSKDIGESKDLSTSKPEVLKSMVAQLDAWESELMEPRWGPGGPSKKGTK